MWTAYRKQIADSLSALSVTGKTGGTLSPEEGFAYWADMLSGLGENGLLHIVGNGASAAMASHFAADLTKNRRIRAHVFTDAAFITALGNDYGYENSFSMALEHCARKGDCLVAISSSGNSPNIVNACIKADEMGMNAVTISGMRPNNEIRALGTLNFYVPAQSYSLAESSHAILLHHVTDLLVQARGLARASTIQEGA